MAKRKAKKIEVKEGLSISVSLQEANTEFGKKLVVKVALLQDGKVISEDSDSVRVR